MPNKLRWGVLSTAAIGLKKVIPAMQHGEFTSVVAIASRDLATAQKAAAAVAADAVLRNTLRLTRGCMRRLLAMILKIANVYCG